MDPIPDAGQLLQSEDVFSESLMQVDEPMDDYTNPSTPKKLGPVSPTTQSGACISDESLQLMSTQLERAIQPGDDDVYIRRSLGTVWINVNHALAKDPGMTTRLASKEEFEQNVQQNGEQQFITLLRDVAKKHSWRNLLENGTSFISFVLRRSDHLLSLDVFLKRNLEYPYKSQLNRSPASKDGAQ